jgi:DNA-directed RNA polymerase subunit RPC12/RpoP
MQEETLDGHVGRPVTIDICLSCQSFWFDAHESLALSPGGTLALFRLIGEHAGKRSFSNADLAKCPRCKARLRLTQDMQRTTRFSYLRCPNDHGRLTTFFDFLREKDFVRPLTPEQLRELRQNVQSVNCSSCGAPVDVTHRSACAHCGSPLSMLDMKQAEALVERLRDAATNANRISPTLPIDLVRARRDITAAFDAFEKDKSWFERIERKGLMTASVGAFVDWLTD